MSDLMVVLKKRLNIDKMIVKQLHRKNDRDIDIIISKEEFDKIVFDKNFYLLKNRVKCDKHIFYLFYYKGEIYVIDFNIDGLFINGRIFYDLEKISLFIKKTRFTGVFCLKRKFYLEYKRNKKKSFFATFRFDAFAEYIRYTIFRYQKLNIRKGKVVFIGVDGSGKTTTLKNLVKKFYLLYPSVIYMGWSRNFMNIFVKKYREIKYSNCGDKKNKIATEFKSRTFFEISINYIELITRYIYSLFNTTSYLLFYDRYFYDWLICSDSQIVQKVFTYFIPKPDIIFYCTGEAEILFFRKKELSKRLIVKQQNKIESKNYLRGAIRLDTTKMSESEVLELATQKILNILYHN